MPRCPWATTEIMAKYHDEEWGAPLHNDRALFELLILEGAQAGLSWSTILNKRENYRAAFAKFDPVKVARFGEKEHHALRQNPGIVRNRLKISGSTLNARAFLAVQEEFGSFDAYLWRFVAGKPIQGKRERIEDVPARSEESDALSKDLKKRGFKFVGTTIMYAFMQAAGLVNDHLVTCPRCAAVRKPGARRD